MKASNVAKPQSNKRAPRNLALWTVKLQNGTTGQPVAKHVALGSSTAIREYWFPPILVARHAELHLTLGDAGKISLVQLTAWLRTGHPGRIVASNVGRAAKLKLDECLSRQ